jgi:RNA polymerase sigma-70 factor (TIGR02960 family)
MIKPDGGGFQLWRGSLSSSALPHIEAEFATFADRYRRELHVHCYRMLGSFDGAEDAVQETMVRAWRARGALDHPDRMRAWLYKIATNACLDEIKRRDRRLPTLDSFADIAWLQPYPDHLLEGPATEKGEPGEALVERETIELTFLAVIQLLPPPQRATLILREVVGWSAKETAELLDLSVPAVNSALQRARETLRRHLPAERRESWTAPDASEAERRALEGFISAHERGDNEAALELIADDIRVTMPPNGLLFDGRDAVVPLIERAHSGVDGAWRLVPTAANRHPAAGSYLRAPGDDEFRAFKLDVLRVAGGKIVELTTFGADRFPAFGLARTL